MKIMLIRHGRTEANEKHLYCGSTDIGLSEKGRSELDAVKEGKEFPDITGMRVLTSGKKRCEETLTALFGEVPHEADPDFSEMDFGAFEMRSYEEMKEDPQYIEWISGDNEANIAPGGESGNLMRERAVRGLARIIGDGRDTLLVTHGGVIAALMDHLFPAENRNRYEWQPACGEGYLVDLKECRWDAVPCPKELR